MLFNGRARCAECHPPPTYTDVLKGPNPNVPLLHLPAQVGQKPDYANRSATKLYRATPLRGAWQHSPYFHDGSAGDFMAVVNHYANTLPLALSDVEKSNLVEFLKSL